MEGKSVLVIETYIAKPKKKYAVSPGALSQNSKVSLTNSH